MNDLYYNIEHPLIYVLANMEINGITVKTNIIDDLKKDIKNKIEILIHKIYDEAGVEFDDYD